MKSRSPILVVRTAAALSIGACLLFSACAENPTCQDYGNCPENGGSGGSAIAGKSGATGKAGNRSNAGDGGSGGASDDLGGSGGAAGTGIAGAEAGASGAAGAPPCNGECQGATPVCNPATALCVECLTRTDCKAPLPTCDTASYSCVECAATTDCTNGAKPLCDKAAAKCVACLKQSDCTDPTASTCTGGACTACTVDADCSNIAGKSVCDAGTCVQCTAKKFAACGLDSGTPLVCDSAKRSCSTNKQQSAGLCQTCVTDAQCKAGQTCVLDKFGSPPKDVGYFCHWKKGDVANGAPADCFATGKPYSGTQVNVASIDGDVSDICTLAVSTCVAEKQFKSKDCTMTSAPNDASCGFAPAKDAKCAQVPASSSYRCTMICLSDDDCPGTTCDTGTAPRVCSFN